MNSLNDILNYLKELSKTDVDTARSSYKYFVINDYINRLNDYLRNATKEIVQIGSGNVLSNGIIVIDDMNDKNVIDFLREIFKKVNVKCYDFYITSANKSSNAQLNRQVLQKEFQVIKPKVIVTFSNISGIDTCGAEVHSINYDYLKCYLAYRDKTLSAEDQNKLNKIKNYIWSNLKHIFKGYTPLCR